MRRLSIRCNNRWRADEIEIGLQLFGSCRSPFLWIIIVLDSLNLGGGLLVKKIVLRMRARPVSCASLTCLTVMPSGPGAEFFHPTFAWWTSAGLMGLDKFVALPVMSAGSVAIVCRLEKMLVKCSSTEASGGKVASCRIGFPESMVSARAVLFFRYKS